MKEKEVLIDWNGKQEQVLLKKLTFGELNQLTEEATTIKMMGSQPLINISQKVLKEQSLLKSIKKAPFTIELKAIQELDAEVGNLLFEEFTNLNNVNEKKKSVR